MKSCPRNHAMIVLTKFRFDHEPGDTARDHASLEWFKARGIELGAMVTVWYCEPCDLADATFDYSDDGGGGVR